MIILDDCQLEVDPRRGVIYVHGPKGTALRICGLPSLPEDSSFLDITVLGCILSHAEPQEIPDV